MLAQIRYRVGNLIGRPRRWRVFESVPKGGVGAEIGVFCGELSPEILRVARPVEFHLIDGWWTIYGDFYPKSWRNKRGERIGTRESYDEARARVGDDPRVKWHVGSDLDILPTFPDQFFDWVYLDSSHQYEHTRQELEILKDKMKPSGLIVGDDWKEDPADGNHGESVAVKEFCLRYGWELGPIDPIFDQYTLTPPSRA
jgi:Methyltransferase domain